MLAFCDPPKQDESQIKRHGNIADPSFFRMALGHCSALTGSYAQTFLKVRCMFGSMSRRGNPYDNPYAESFMTTLKVEAVYVTEYGTFEDVVADLSRFIEAIYNERRLHSALSYTSPNRYEEKHARDWTKSAA